MGKRNHIPLEITVLASQPSKKAPGVLIELVHHSRHTRAFSSKIFGNDYHVRLAIPAFSTSAYLTGGLYLETLGRKKFDEIIKEDSAG